MKRVVLVFVILLLLCCCCSPVVKQGCCPFVHSFVVKACYLDYPNLAWVIAKSWAPVNVFFCLMLFTSMAALNQFSSHGDHFQKCVQHNITTAMADYFLFGNKLESLSICAFAIMLFGTIAVASNGMETSLVSLFWMLFNCVSMTGYICCMCCATQKVTLTKFGMIYVNNILCVLFLVPVAYLQCEIAVFLWSMALHTWDYGFKNFLPALLASF